MPKRILIIEDDDDVLNVLKEVLEFNNFDVKGINRTDDILEIVNEYHPDLVLTDFLLSGTNGGKICQLIKSNKDTCHLPVILLSGYPDLAIALGNFGFDDFIAKPFSIKDLMKRINKCLQES